jgi:hypothetical protein
MLRRIISTTLLTSATLFYSTNIIAQEPHEHPDHIKGTSGQIYKALPFYNEACELYAKGRIDAAKESLYEAIETSFALTEAHLFLADIYREEGKIDSAFYFYNSGIDFAVEQKPHYYFYLMETGVQLGQYFIMKHNLKHFKKLYGKEGETPYEEEYPYTRDDYEFWEATLAMINDYQNWTKKARFNYKIPYETTIISASQQLYLNDQSGTFRLIDKKGKKKYKSVKGLPESIEDLYITSDGSIAIYALKTVESQKLYIAKGNGKKFSEGIELDEKINMSSYQEAPFITTDKSRLYFTSNVNGNMDLFVAELDTSSFSVGSVEPLDKINTEKDETSLYFDSDQKRFYFASNGHISFGGYDIYYCDDFEIANGTMFPLKARNMGASFNSNFNELRLHRFKDDFVLVKDQKGEHICEVLSPVPQDEFYYEIDSFENLYKSKEVGKED